ncbi:MAG TPA: hypothetical protein VFF64_05930 [Candidatus Eremiobacteraceae bacterium]|nr:hypothetical protein [Candidatus Eremiobacteraceae bacterium]
MKRETILAIVLVALLAAVPVMFAQDQDDDDHGRPAPPAPSDVIGPQLIAWSELQEPQPVSARTPPSDQTKPQPNQQPVQTADSSKEQALAADSSHLRMSRILRSNQDREEVNLVLQVCPEH